MSQKNQAFTYGIGAVAVMAVAMVGFYYISDRYQAKQTATEVSEPSDIAPATEEKSEFVGVYSSTNGPMESTEGRIAYFVVNRRDEGGYLGSAKVDKVGSEESSFLECVDVKIEGADFFLKCQDAIKGVISVSGTVSTQGGIKVDAKILWVKDGNSLLEVQRVLQHGPAE